MQLAIHFKIHFITTCVCMLRRSCDLFFYRLWIDSSSKWIERKKEMVAQKIRESFMVAIKRLISLKDEFYSRHLTTFNRSIHAVHSICRLEWLEMWTHFDSHAASMHVPWENSLGSTFLAGSMELEVLEKWMIPFLDALLVDVLRAHFILFQSFIFCIYEHCRRSVLIN